MASKVSVISGRIEKFWKEHGENLMYMTSRHELKSTVDDIKVSDGMLAITNREDKYFEIIDLSMIESYQQRESSITLYSSSGIEYHFENSF